jgi:hypothetical protein
LSFQKPRATKIAAQGPEIKEKNDSCFAAIFSDFQADTHQLPGTFAVVTSPELSTRPARMIARISFSLYILFIRRFFRNNDFNPSGHL